jgi:hypothetical protein
VHAVDTGDFLDDHETPFHRRLPRSALDFDGQAPVGTTMDDYLTSIEASSHGSGFVSPTIFNEDRGTVLT